MCGRSDGAKIRGASAGRKGMWNFKCARLKLPPSRHRAAITRHHHIEKATSRVDRLASLSKEQ